LSEEKLFNYQRGNRNPINCFPGLAMAKQHLKQHNNNNNNNNHSTANNNNNRDNNHDINNDESNNLIGGGSVSTSSSPRTTFTAEVEGGGGGGVGGEDSLFASGSLLLEERGSSVLTTGSYDPPPDMIPTQIYKPLLPLLKLMTQSDILGQLSATLSGGGGLGLLSSPSSVPEFRRFTVEDANHHLQTETDVSWNYTNYTQKYESWLTK
jgi:hypothetical protein